MKGNEVRAGIVSMEAVCFLEAFVLVYSITK